MDLYKQIVRRTFIPLALWRAGETRALAYLREFERTQYLSLEELREIQFRRLRALLEHAHANCSFYRDRMAGIGMHPSDVKTLEDVGKLPVLEKKDIQEHQEELVAANWPKQDLIPNRTGGSTGSPVSFYLSSDRKQSRFGATWRHNRWAGFDLGDKVAAIWGSPLDQPPPGLRSRIRNLTLERQLFLDAGNLTEAKIASFHEALNKFRPKIIVAYSRSAALFARYLRDKSMVPPQPQSIITSAEVLEPEDRALIETVFGCPVFNRYGCREVSVIATECQQRDGLHVMAEGLYVEVVPVAPQADDSKHQVGAIVVTDLMNFAMPLIRYRIGDMGAWQEGKCACGRSLPRLRNIAGRLTDFVVGVDGRLVSGPFLTLVIAKRPALGQVQIIQEELGKVLYRVKPGPGFQPNDDLEYLRAATLKHIGPGTRADFELVNEIPHEASGKYLFCRSSVSPSFVTKP
jgi:phenylacetate-CoA ligase